VKPIYDEIEELGNYYTIVKVNSKSGIIDNHGKETIPPKYDWIGEFCDDGIGCKLAKIQLNGKVGFINRKLKVVLNP